MQYPAPWTGEPERTFATDGSFLFPCSGCNRDATITDVADLPIYIMSKIFDFDHDEILVGN